jgi:hypothetical protein
VLLYHRLKALCCQTWGISPRQFEEDAAADAIALEDVIEVLALRCSEPILGANVERLIFREEWRRKEGRLEEVQRLVMLRRITTDPEKAAEIDAELARLSDGG